MTTGAVPAWRSLYPFASHFMPVDGHTLHYLDEGPREAPPLLLLHGNPTWSFYWREVIKAFTGPFRVVAVDHMGCGLSDKPQDWPYRLENHIANASRLVAQLGLSRITLGVHDWGGAIGMGLATRRPELFSRFVVLNSAAFRSTRLTWRIAVCRWPRVGPFLVRNLNGFALAATVMASERGLAGPVRDGYLAPYRRRADRVAILRFVQDIPMEPSHPSWPTLAAIEDGLEALRGKPMLIAWGEKDWCFTPAFREEWQRRFPQARVYRAERAGHYVLEDARDEVLAAMREFLLPAAAAR